MKIQKFKMRMWLELLLALPSLYLFLLASMLSITFTKELMKGKFFPEEFFYPLLANSGIAAIVALWVVIFLGTEQIRQMRRLRIFVVTALIVGLVITVFLTLKQEFRGFYLEFPIASCVLLSLIYLSQLIWGKRKSASGSN